MKIRSNLILRIKKERKREKTFAQEHLKREGENFIIIFACLCVFT